MNRFSAFAYDYVILKHKDYKPFPYLRHPDGDKEMYCVSPIHGRSFIVGRRDDGRYIISKGNGLSYSERTFLYTPEFGDDTWGLLLKQDAIRDFTVGDEIRELGIKTNIMECVLELDCKIKLQNGSELKPILLQYNVECPFRICDAPFMTREQINKEVAKWEAMNDRGFKEKYMIAANVLIRNMRIMHDHGILHNAIHNQNYTWALELLDFELAHTPNYPYSREDYVRHVPMLMPREVIHTYEVINYIAGVLRERIYYSKTDALFNEYGYNVGNYNVYCCP